QRPWAPRSAREQDAPTHGIFVFDDGIAPDEVVSLGVPNRPLQRETSDLQGPGGIAIRQLAEPGPDITGAQDAQRPGTYRVKQRPEQALVKRARPLGRAVQALAQPVLHSLAHRIGLRGLDAIV